MAILKPRRKTTPVRRNVRKGGDLQRLHIKVTSPRIVMFQVLRGLGKGLKCALFLSLLGLIGYGGHLGVQHLFLGNQKYRLQEIDLQTNGHLNHSRIVNLAEIDLEKTIFAVDTNEVRERLSDLPEVVDCVVERRLPGTLKIRVEERVPIVWIQCESLGFPGRHQGGVLADENGITFPCEGSLWEASKHLPVIVIKTAKGDDFEHGSKAAHLDMQRALNLVKTFATMDVREQWLPAKVLLINDYSMEVVARDDSRAVFGMYEHERQLDDFISIREHALKTRRTIEHINLIPHRNIPVKFAPDAVLVTPKPKHGP